MLRATQKPASGDVFACKLTSEPGGPLYTGHTGIITTNGNVAAHERGVTERQEVYPGNTRYRRYVGE